jgi:hypothetical protein
MVSDRFTKAYVPDVVPDSDLGYFDRGGMALGSDGGTHLLSLSSI